VRYVTGKREITGMWKYRLINQITSFLKVQLGFVFKYVLECTLMSVYIYDVW